MAPWLNVYILDLRDFNLFMEKKKNYEGAAWLDAQENFLISI